MRLIPWWALLSAACAPLVLILGWVVVGMLSGPSYDPATQTISSLEAQDVPGHWLVVAALAGLGTCHLVTALGLRAASRAGRLALAGGGVASILVALFQEPQHGGSLRHGVTVGVGFALLCVWPGLTVDHRRGAPWALRPGPAALVIVLMLLGALWFVIALNHHGAAGVAERLVTTVQSCWPLIVVLSCPHHAGPGPRTGPQVHPRTRRRPAGR
ncbi:DUF998 domain-containing protein [Kitasatospora sp. NBC_01287]|uniref:DUF998 domain-containing protein n=1 Tax=Kitasatospora sp. NBC_01287 TaxID=2903573 RepID=UPI00224D82B8|nr:DUF998 domain-containing protein [Kitasatospora sp. NBC_01287]MCX4744168.1 DUF998 domain-containing protein [Kitasatospora sp. NBC_01287]